MGWRYLILCFALLLSSSSARAQQDVLADLGDLLERILNLPASQAPGSDPSQPQDSGDMGFTIRALNAAMESGRTGTPTEWYNPSSVTSGAVTPLSDQKYSGGRTCRMFRRVRGAGDTLEIHDGTACRTTDGWWTIRDEHQVFLPPDAGVTEFPDISGTSTSAGPSSSSTTEVQELLAQIGYDPGPIDGAFGPRTAAAIRAFERDQGLAEQGQVSDVLIEQLRDAASVISQPSSDAQLETAQELIDALEELDWAVTEKINHDVETTARAFADAYDIEQSRRIADFVTAPLVIIEQTIGLVALAERPSEVAASLGDAGSVLEIASILMSAGELMEAGRNLQLAIDGPTYSSLASAMLDEAASSSDMGEYKTTVQLHLYGVGNRKSPVWARHRVGETVDLVWGARAVKRRISEQIATLSKELSELRIGEGVSVNEILAYLSEVTTAINRSKANNVAVGIDDTGAVVVRSDAAITIGSIAALGKIRILALDNYDNDLQLKQYAVISSGVEAGISTWNLYVGYERETGQILGEVKRSVVTPLAFAMGAAKNLYSTGARQQVNGIPHEMLLALPAELSNTWALVDQTLSHIRNAVTPPDTAPAEEALATAPAAPPGPETTSSGETLSEAQTTSAGAPAEEALATAPATLPGPESAGPVELPLELEQASAATPACAIEQSKSVSLTQPRGDYERGLELYQQAAYAAAYKVWLPLAKNGDARAQTMIGELYKKAWGVEFNVHEAERWHLMSAAQGYPDGQYNLGNLYVEGWGITDCAKGMSWLREAAMQGHSKAQFLLAHIYESGPYSQWGCVPYNYVKAYMWATLAAESDDNEIAQKAQELLEDVKNFNSITPAQMAQAKQQARQLEQKINQTQSVQPQVAPSSGQSEFYWAMTAYNSKDYNNSFQILEPLANTGDSCARHMLGFFYDKGLGVSVDEARAKDWYQKAATQGDAEAAERLAILEAAERLAILERRKSVAIASVSPSNISCSQTSTVLQSMPQTGWPGWLGVSFNKLTTVVAAVVPAGPAARAGVRAGDKILAIDGLAFDGIDIFRNFFETIMFSRRSGQTVSLTVERGRNRFTVSVVLGVRPVVKPPAGLCLSNICIGFTPDQILRSGQEMHPLTRRLDLKSRQQEKICKYLLGLNNKNIDLLSRYVVTFAISSLSFHIDNNSLRALSKVQVACYPTYGTGEIGSDKKNKIIVTLAALPGGPETPQSLRVVNIKRNYTFEMHQEEDWKRRLLMKFPTAARLKQGRRGRTGVSYLLQATSARLELFDPRMDEFRRDRLSRYLAGHPLCPKAQISID